MEKMGAMDLTEKMELMEKMAIADLQELHQ
jgi:hypothetical protein